MLMNQKLDPVPRDRDQGPVGSATRNVALVTGGSRGLGAELVSGLLARRYAVATLSRTKTAFIDQMMQDPRKGDFCWSALDACDGEALRGYVREIVIRFGRIDVLVNNVGGATVHSAVATDPPHQP